eukprot:4410886-Amphidinium_carterae.1
MSSVSRLPTANTSQGTESWFLVWCPTESADGTSGIAQAYMREQQGAPDNPSCRNICTFQVGLVGSQSGDIRYMTPLV